MHCFLFRSLLQNAYQDNIKGGGKSLILQANQLEASSSLPLKCYLTPRGIGHTSSALSPVNRALDLCACGAWFEVGLQFPGVWSGFGWPPQRESTSATQASAEICANFDPVDRKKRRSLVQTYAFNSVEKFLFICLIPVVWKMGAVLLSCNHMMSEIHFFRHYFMWSLHLTTEIYHMIDMNPKSYYRRLILGRQWFPGYSLWYIVMYRVNSRLGYWFFILQLWLSTLGLLIITVYYVGLLVL